MEAALILVGSCLFPPILGTVLLVLVLATFGKSLGVRKNYVRLLLRIFEWGSRQIDSSQLWINVDESAKGDDDDEDDGDTGVDTASSTDEQGADDQSMVAARLRHGSGNLSAGIIKREASESIMFKLNSGEPVVSRGSAVLNDSIDYIKDEVTSRFEAEHLASWNMLTRTSISYHFVNWKLTLLWVSGFIFRYGFLLPLRLVILTVGLIYMIVSTAFVGLCPDGRLKRELNRRAMLMCYRILSHSVSAIVRFHNSHNRAQNGGICVANHTSPIDVMILGIDNVYALIGQSQGGLLGIIQRALSRASSHIWFERSEGKDRALVTRKLREHTTDPHKLPILIFPEGTCINNTSVMMFKKGSFEIGTKIFPIAMKYDSRFGDAFWNSAEQSWIEYLVRMMTSWAIICDVWYLPAMEKYADEDAVAFANRVKKCIAKRGGLVDLEWDGQLKRSRVSPKMVAEQQKLYWKRIARTRSECTAEDDAAAERQRVLLLPNEELPEPIDETDDDDDESGDEMAMKMATVGINSDTTMMVGTGDIEE